VSCPWRFYNHVANKEELLDGMVEVVIGEIAPPIEGPGWRDAIRQRVLWAGQALLRHRWAVTVIESRTYVRRSSWLESSDSTSRAGAPPRSGAGAVRHRVAVPGPGSLVLWNERTWARLTLYGDRAWQEWMWWLPNPEPGLRSR
jgi:AcrR family transcriptional regulator